MKFWNNCSSLSNLAYSTQGLTSSGYLLAVGEDDKSYELHPDGNRYILCHLTSLTNDKYHSMLMLSTDAAIVCVLFKSLINGTDYVILHGLIKEAACLPSIVKYFCCLWVSFYERYLSIKSVEGIESLIILMHDLKTC